MTELDATMQRRIVWFLALFLVVALQSIIHVREEQQSDGFLGPSGTVVLHAMAQSQNETFDKFGFYVMGDTPYADWEESMLEQQIAELHRNQLDHILFTVHVGDIQKVQRTNCAESHYQHMASVLKAGPLPTLVIPGDNDWFDCSDRKASLSYFQSHLTMMDQDWHHDLAIVRHAEHPELLAMEHDGILFLSIHLINARIMDESQKVWKDRMMRNQEWVKQQLDHYFATKFIRGIIILGHSLRSPRTRSFFESLATNFLNDEQRLKVPVMYLHGDGHNWDIDHKFSHQLGWKNFYDVQVDQGAYADPCIVEFARQINGKTIPLRQQHENQILFGNGLMRIDRQRGRYTDSYLEKFKDSS